MKQAASIYFEAQGTLNPTLNEQALVSLNIEETVDARVGRTKAVITEGG